MHRRRSAMETVNVRVRYRPTRIGLCIDTNDMEGFRKAVRVATTMWGRPLQRDRAVGKTTVGAQAIVDAFRLDALFAVTESEAVNNFIAANPHLRWPDYEPHLFVVYVEDVGHPANLPVWMLFPPDSLTQSKRGSHGRGCVKSEIVASDCSAITIVSQGRAADPSSLSNLISSGA
jgi:hypothetical protein